MGPKTGGNDAASLQPLAQGIFTITAGAPAFAAPPTGYAIATQRGFSAVARTPTTSAGDFTLTLDPGLIGAAGVDPNFAYTIVTLRGAPGGINEKAVSYVASTTTGVGCNQIRITLSVSGTLTDPAGSVEVIVYRQSTPDNYFVTISGPLAQPVANFA